MTKDPGVGGKRNGHRGTPPLDHVTRALRLDHYLGRVRPGTRLPSVRSVARRLRISRTTAFAVYQTLQADGLVEGRPRSGVFLRRVGLEPPRRPRDVELFRMLGGVSTRLAQIRVSPQCFARLLMWRNGQERRDGFTFGFLSYRESFDLLHDQIQRRLGFAMPIVPLIARSTHPDECTAQVRDNRSIRCLLTTYLYAKPALALGRRFACPVIVIQLKPSGSALLSPPAAGRRWIVTRDPETASGFRRLVCTVCLHDAADSPCGSTLDEVERLEEDGTDCRCARVCTASLADRQKIARIAGDAAEVYATRTALPAVQQLLGPRREVRPIPMDIADETFDEILFHYLFGDGLNGWTDAC